MNNYAHSDCTLRDAEILHGRKSKYRILGDAVKRGGFSEVYKAIDEGEQGCLVAVKLIDLNSKKIKRREHEKRIKSECEIHKRLENCPRVIRFVECFDLEKNNQDMFCIVLEWAEKGDLKDYLRQKGQPGLAEPEVSRLVTQIVDGVQFFQKNNLVHRDIKLQNILLDKDNNVKFTDFGLATKLSSRNDKMNTFCGTPNYLPPEMIARNGYSNQVDIWSLGILIYQLLVGRPPVEGDNPKDTMKKIPLSEIHIPELLSEHAKDLISKTLEKNPTRRISIENLLDHPFLARRERTMSDISDLHSRFSQISHSQHGQQQSNSFYNNRPQATTSAAHQRGASRQSSRRSSVSSNVSENSRTTGRKSRSHSVERIPSREYMPPPQTPSIQSYSANTTRDPSTGYGSGISQNIDTSGSRISPRSGKSAPAITPHYRQQSLPTRFTTRDVAIEPQTTNDLSPLPQLCARRLIPTRSQKNKNICHIISGERLVLETLDQDGFIKKSILVACRSQTVTEYTPSYDNQKVTPKEQPYLPNGIGRSEIHRYPDIPAKLRKKWNYLHAYSQLIKSKTTKIKIWTDLGDARLMENGSFEVNFYGGERFEQKEGDEVGSYFDYAGKRRTIDGNYPNTTIEHHLAHANRQYESVKRIEQAIEDIMGPDNGNFEFFPINIGRRDKAAGSRPRSAPSCRAMSTYEPPSTPIALSQSNIAYIHSTTASTNGSISPHSRYPTPPSTFTSSIQNTSSSSRRGRVISEKHYDGKCTPIQYACFKSSGMFDFKSQRYYYTDKVKKDEIRVKNGPIIQYNKLGNGEFGLSWPAGADQEIREAINFWLKHPDGKFSLQKSLKESINIHK